MEKLINTIHKENTKPKTQEPQTNHQINKQTKPKQKSQLAG